MKSTLLISITLFTLSSPFAAFSQRDLKFHASSLVSGINEVGAEFIRKDIGCEGSLGYGDRDMTRIVDGKTEAYEAKKFTVGARLNFYKKLEKSIDNRYISLFSNYTSTEMTSSSGDQRRVGRVGVAYGRKWLVYNRLGVQADAGVGYSFLNEKKDSKSIAWNSLTNNTASQEISLFQSFSLPIRISFILRI